jgi:integrase/recombinase XerD
MNLNEHIETHCALLLSERGYSKETVKSYRWALRCALAWLRTKTANRPQKLPPEAMTAELLKRYFLYMETPKPKGKGFRPRTLRVHWAAMKGFCGYLVEKEILPDLRFPRVKMPKKDPVQRRLITDAQMAALEEAVERIHDPFRLVLARALLQTMLSCGLRVSELRALKVSDLSLDNCWLLVELGKGGKSRKCMLSDRCIDALRAWLAIRPEPHGPKRQAAGALWMRTSGQRLGPGGLTDLFVEIETIAGFARGERTLLCHAVRHNAATRLYRNSGHDIEAVRLFLGHSDIATVQQYLDLDEGRRLQIRNLTNLDATPECSELASGRREISLPSSPQKPNGQRNCPAHEAMLISVKKPDLKPARTRQASRRFQVERFSRPPS